MSPEEFSKYEDEKTIKELKKKIANIIDGQDPYVVMSAIQEIFFDMIPYYCADPQKFLFKFGRHCLKLSKTTKKLEIPDDED